MNDVDWAWICLDCEWVGQHRPAYKTCPLCLSDQVITRDEYHLRELENLAAWKEWAKT